MKTKHKNLFSAISSLFILALTIPGTSSAKLIDRVAAVVGDKIITVSDLQKATGNKTAYKDRAPSDKDLALKKLSQMIDNMLIEDEINKRGIEVTDPELDMFIQTIMTQNRLKTHEELKSMLALQGLTYDGYRSTLKKQIEKTKIMNTAVRTKINISDQDLKNYYMQNMEAAREPDTLHLKNIFLGSTSKNRSQKEAEAKTVLNSLKKGERFEDLAKKHSEDPNAKSGGDLGFMTALDLNQKIYSEVSSLKPGQTTGIIEVANGFYILKLDERKKGGIQSFDKAKEGLRDKLMSEELEKGFSNWLSELKSKTYIDIKI